MHRVLILCLYQIPKIYLNRD